MTKLEEEEEDLPDDLDDDEDVIPEGDPDEVPEIDDDDPDSDACPDCGYPFDECTCDDEDDDGEDE